MTEWLGRRSRRAFLATGSVVVGCRKSPEHSAQNTGRRSLRLGAVTPGAMFQLPVVVAQELGYFRQKGIEVELLDVASGARAMQALLGGSAEVISPLFDQLVLMAAENRDARSFLLMQRCPIQVLAVSPRTQKSIRRISELKGATIGVTSPGSPAHLQLNYMVKRAGIHPQDISVVGLGSNAARTAALEAGKVDAAVLGDPGATLLKRRYPNLIVLADTRTSEGTRDAFGSDVYPGGVLIASERWLRDNADTARRLASAVLKSMKWIRETPAPEIASRVPRQYRIDDEHIYAEAIQHLVPALSSDGMMPDDAPELVKTVLSTFDEKIRTANVDAARTFTNAFVSED